MNSNGKNQSANTGFDEAQDARNAQEVEGGGVRGVIARLPEISLFFLGLGIYRAWIELIYVHPLVTMPANAIAGHNAFDVAMAITLIIAALLARKIVPISEKKTVLWGAGILMVFGTLLNFSAVYQPALAEYVAYPAAITAGVGTALIILLWAEFYGCINPLRVALYYSASFLFAAFIIFLLKGVILEYLVGFMLLLPPLSVICLVLSFRTVPLADRPKRAWGKFSFPWKPVLLMAIYAFAYGLRESSLYVETGPHSSSGVIVVAALVFIGVLSRSDKFNFGIIYRVGLPLMVCGFLLVPSLAEEGSALSNFCVAASYDSFSILIMLILSNITYRLGIGAVWLFGIERGLRALFMFLGRECNILLVGSVLSETVRSTTVTAVVVVLVVACTMILLSEQELSSRWGISFLDSGSAGEESSELNRLAVLCSDLSRKYDLSPREEEVLHLLAQRKSVARIEKELFIANGTAKAHIRHIYGKMGIHSKGELLALLGLE